MVKVYVADGEDFGPVVTEVKGIRGGREWVANETQDALAYGPDDSVRGRREEVTSVRRLSKLCHPFARLRTGFEEQSDEKSLQTVLARPGFRDFSLRCAPFEMTYKESPN